MKLQYDETLSNFAFNFNSRLYTMDRDDMWDALEALGLELSEAQAGPCIT